MELIIIPSLARELLRVPVFQNYEPRFSVKHNIYDINGTQLKSIPIHHTSKGDVTIKDGELDAGMYMYMLVAQGRHWIRNR